MKAMSGSAARKSHRSWPQVKGVINGAAEGDPRVQRKHPGPTNVANVILFVSTEAAEFTDSEVSFPRVCLA